MMNPYRRKILDEQDKGQMNAQLECVKKYGEGVLKDLMQPVFNETSKIKMCPPFWDGILCWPHTPPNSLASNRCPSYVAGFLSFKNATRTCLENGMWFINEATNSSWSDYTNCSEGAEAKIVVDLDKYNVSNSSQAYFPVVKIISQTGYAFSLTTLIIAFSIMLSIKKLHCARNILHMHLFASFMLKAFLSILKDLTFVEGIGLAGDIACHNGSMYFNINSETNNWACKLVTSLWQYFITANYSWILMEGLYLHNLIFRALFADSNNNIRWYVILGWGLPLIIIVKWIIVRLSIEDTLCWTTHESYKAFLILAIPTLISILINLVLFIRISMVLYSKLRSPVNEDSRRYQKWVKSTLVLVPLFGVHYAIFLILFYPMKTNKILELVWLTCDRIFGSFQGFFVAVLYCFLNGEVKAEIKPRIYHCFTWLATAKYSQYFFPCRKKFLRSVAGRSSVCTTMSCSSLYTNGVMHRNSKTRLDNIPKLKHSVPEKTKDHFCHNGTKSLQDMSSRRNSKSRKLSTDLHRHSQPLNSSGTIPTTESTFCLETTPDKTELEVNEETVKMVHNNF